MIGACGGGADGAPLIEAFIRAAGRLRPQLGGHWLAVTGPLMPANEAAALTRLGESLGVNVKRVITELRQQIAQADCLVGMPGYNTTCDVLSHQPRAVFVPRAGTSREQEIRAGRIAEWGIARVVPASTLAEGALTEAIEQALAGRPPPPPPVSLNGTQRALELFDSVLTAAHSLFDPNPATTAAAAAERPSAGHQDQPSVYIGGRTTAAQPARRHLKVATASEEPESMRDGHTVRLGADSGQNKKTPATATSEN